MVHQLHKKNNILCNFCKCHLFGHNFHSRMFCCAEAEGWQADRRRNSLSQHLHPQLFRVAGPGSSTINHNHLLRKMKGTDMEKSILALHERELPWNPTNLQTPRGSCELPVKILKLTVIAWTESSLQELRKLTTASVKFLPELKLVLRLHVSSRYDLCSIFTEVDGKDLPPMDTGHIKTLITAMDLLHAWDLCETDGSMLLWRRM